MEDLPQELDFIIAQEAEKRGLSPAIVIDAHNSIEGPFDPKGLVALTEAAANCVEKALVQKKSPFEIGVAKVVPEEFNVEDGMGSGGINVLIVKVGNQKTAYITIDGNNMVSGLREKILLALREIGITDGEVLTTDTHAVNGIVLTERGYHPIGEAIDQAKLIDYVREAAVTALGNIESAEASWRIITIPNVKIIGEKQVGALCLITDETAKVSKKLAVLLFSLAGVLLTTLLVLL
jgi:putative membrane protein